MHTKIKSQEQGVFYRAFFNFNSCNNYHKRHSFGYLTNNDGYFNNNILRLNNVAPYTTRSFQDATCLFCFVTAQLKLQHDFTSHNMNQNTYVFYYTVSNKKEKYTSSYIFIITRRPFQKVFKLKLSRKKKAICKLAQCKMHIKKQCTICFF